MVSIRYYADFACPYCHVENERLLRMGRADDVEFRPVQLLPDCAAPWDPDDAHINAIMDSGWSQFLERVQDVKANRPASVPNTTLATRAMAEASLSHPDKAVELRTALFRAVWVEGLDLGRPEVVEQVWNQVGLPPRDGKGFSREARHLAKFWATSWNNGPFDRRVPTMATDEGQRLLGLAEEERIAQFLDDPSRGDHHAEVCKVSDG